jgi:UDP-perosamine 4-acetyltransferase
MSKPVVMLGHGGHARVVLDVLQLTGRQVAGILTPDLEAGCIWQGVSVLGGDDWLDSAAASHHAYALGVGLVPGRVGWRPCLFRGLRERGLEMPALIHPGAIVAQDVLVREGVQIMAGAIVQPGARLGADVLVNTGARIDHDCAIGAHAHIGPGAILCGEVSVGEGVFVGAGATLIPGVRIGAGAQVAAGAVVVRDIPPGMRHIPGRPQRLIEE